jgi:lysophospholipase L1-like esterase
MPRKTLFILSVTLNVAIVLYLVGKRIYYKYYNKPTAYAYTQEDYMTATAKIQAELPIDTNDIVFVGNSLTSNFPVYELFGSLKVKNRGIGSNQTTHILERIPRIASYHPKTILIEAGINDFNIKRSVAETFSNYQKIVDTIRATSPRTEIIIQSTLPTCRESLPLMPMVDSLNGILKQYCEKEKMLFLDVAPVLSKNNCLDSTLTWDGIHLNLEGYRKWLALVKPLIK